MGLSGVAVFDGMQAEASIVERHNQGDTSAFAEVLLQHKDAVYGYLVRCRIGPGDRDDLCQEIFMRVHKALGRFVAERPMRAWIFAIAANAVRSYIRAKKPQGMDIDGSDLPARDPSGAEALHSKETARWLEDEIHKLGWNERQVLILSCIEELRQDEVAEALQMPVNTVKTHLRRARLHMAEALHRRHTIAAREEG